MTNDISDVLSDESRNAHFYFAGYAIDPNRPSARASLLLEHRLLPVSIVCVGKQIIPSHEELDPQATRCKTAL